MLVQITPGTNFNIDTVKFKGFLSNSKKFAVLRFKNINGSKHQNLY